MTSELFTVFQEFFWMVFGPVLAAGVQIFIVVSVLSTLLYVFDGVATLIERNKKQSKERG